MKYKAAELGTILGIWAHPDDEAWSMAGLMMRARVNGQRVHLVTATRGEAGNIDGYNDCDRQELAQMREKEMQGSLECIGGVTHQWLDYIDGTMKQADMEEAVQKLVAIIKEQRPDTIITFEPNGITGHDDHRTICEWTTEALRRSESSAKLFYAVESIERYEAFGRELDKKFDIYFNTEEPFLVPEAELNIEMVLNSKELECKMACLRAHKSQTSHMFEDKEMSKHIEQLAEVEAFILTENM